MRLTCSQEFFFFFLIKGAKCRIFEAKKGNTYSTGKICCAGGLYETLSVRSLIKKGMLVEGELGEPDLLHNHIGYVTLTGTGAARAAFLKQYEELKEKAGKGAY